MPCSQLFVTSKKSPSNALAVTVVPYGLKLSKEFKAACISAAVALKDNVFSTLYVS